MKLSNVGEKFRLLDKTGQTNWLKIMGELPDFEANETGFTVALDLRAEGAFLIGAIKVNITVVKITVFAEQALDLKIKLASKTLAAINSLGKPTVTSTVGGITHYAFKKEKVLPSKINNITFDD